MEAEYCHVVDIVRWSAYHSETNPFLVFKSISKEKLQRLFRNNSYGMNQIKAKKSSRK